MARRRPQLEPGRRARRRRGLRRTVGVVAACLVAVGAACAAAILLLSGASLKTDPTALARVDLQPLAGTLAGVHAATTTGKPVRLDRRGSLLTPTTRLAPGQTVDVTVVVRRPGWSGWLLGAHRTEQLEIRAPTAHVTQRWLTVANGHTPVVRFDTPVTRVSVGGKAAPAPSAAAVAIRTKAAGGSTTVAAAVRPWETLGPAVRVTWFPKTPRAALLVDPAPGTQINPLAPLRLTFSQPVASILPDGDSSIGTGGAGKWVQEDTHTLVFHPTGFGAPLAGNETVRLPAAVSVVGGDPATRRLSWRVAPAQFVRLQQLLAQEGYLPVGWSPDGDDVAHTLTAELAAVTSAPSGKFHWRYPNTPSELVALWHEGEPDEVTRGAVMMFEHDHGLDVDGIAGPQVWHAAIEDAIHGRTKDDGYSYVYVHRNVPQLLTLWHNGHVVLTSPGNTGVPAAPTQLGTWPVFEHIPVGRMSGTNPDGSRYDDPGIRWISYFHGGEALHAFNRASFGTPQSLGCVELPLDSAAKVWPYTPIGTLVTIED